MPQNPQQKGAKPRMRKLVVRIPEDLARALKIKAAEEDTSMANLITRMLERELTKGGKK
jgi:predicted HicB family RNase H-like nuclease